MINDSQIYYLSGHAAGFARRNGDEMHAQFEIKWFSRAQALERGIDKDLARRAFDNGYKAGRGPIKSNLP